MKSVNEEEEEEEEEEKVIRKQNRYELYVGENQDLILPSIPLLNYTGVSEQCTKDTKLWLNSLEKFVLASETCMTTGKCDTKTIEENLFAAQQLDSFGRLFEPGLLELQTTFEGNYQECERISGIKYDTNYCYMALRPKFKNPFSSLPFRSAVCMPRSCKHRELPILYNQLGSKLFTARLALCVHRDVEKDTAFWGFTVFMIVMVSIAVLATSIDYLRETVYGKPIDGKENIVLKLLLAFSFWTNAGQVLSVKEQKPGFIKSLDCIRAFSMSWVVAGHSLMYFEFGETLLPLGNVGKHLWNHLFLNAVFSVDTFFLLSGVVVAYLFFKQRPKPHQIKSPLTWILFYLHRYLRLTPPYILFIGFFVVYGPYIQGPYAAWMWNILIRQTDACKDNWWRNLIYINNYDTDQKTTCYGVSWYLAVDTQLYILAPIVLIALYFSFAAGAITIVAGCAGSIITTYILYGVYDNMAADSYHDDASGGFTNVMYQRPWIRCTPYLVGLLTGYVIATYGKRQIRLNWAISVVLWIVAFGIGFACLFSNYDYDKGSYWSPFAKATFYNFSRLGWAIAVAWVIIANHFGWGGPINSFMSHPIWQPFGRLSYCAYIVHWMVLYYFLNVGDRPIQYYNVWQVYCNYAIPATVLSYIAAFFWSCLLEVSTLKLEKMLIEAILGSASGSKPISVKPEEKLAPEGQNTWDIAPEDVKL
uniref:NRF domain-containing protein n=1 Tax=Caenorhabditis tropicalis TaxID=1561998 RepID=A0A1I7UWQ8_9PELO